MSNQIEHLTDYVGQWFKAYRELGEPFEIYFDIDQKNQTERLAVDHALHDGIGALHEIAKSHQWKLTVVGNIKTPPPIGNFKLFCNLILFFYWTRSRKNAWPFQISKAEKENLKVSRQVFSEAETLEIKSRAEKNKVSLNSYLFHTFNLSLNDAFGLNDRSWWMPVNMRPDLGLDTNDSSLTQNYAANFTIDFKKNFSLVDTQSEIKKCLKQQRHWATWWWQLVGRFLNYNLIKTTALKGLENPYAGAFSNLGEWNCSEKNSNVSIYINTLKSHPFGVGVLVWNGKLNLTVRAYPQFPIEPTQLDQLVQNWKKHLFGLSGL